MKECNNILSDFELFYQTYPRRESKRKAMQSYEKVLKDGVTAERLLDGVKRYAIHCKGKERQYIKLPATWLNQGCWEDEYTTNQRESDGIKSVYNAFA